MDQAVQTGKDLVALVRAYNPHTDDAKILDAFSFCKQMHEGQIRCSGEPYYTHPVAVATMLAEQRLDDATIITALLHDTIEDTKASFDTVAQRFGDEIAQLVDGVTNLTKLELSSRETKQAENLRKFFMAVSRDVRVILVKLADRLHNMRTIEAMPEAKQLKKSRETMDIYAPLAGRMGMQWMREELEDLAFKVINPDARTSIIRRYAVLRGKTDDVIDRIGIDMRGVLEQADVPADVAGRAKRPFSIWRKMKEKDQPFSRLSDIYGFRIITRNEEDCYRALGAIHRRWRAVPGRFKDYISQPKTNGYRSIHTTVSGRDGKLVEVQIRTRTMHAVAESGVAAHWSYRDGVRESNPFAVDPEEWVRQLARRIVDFDSPADFLETLKLEMYADQVFCFTPKGDVLKLPRGATPIDFAYAVHTRVGNACIGAKVDGGRKPLWTPLKNGQSVEIITARGQVPQAAWLDVVKTGRAKSAIRRSLREEDRARYIKLGQELARSAFSQIGQPVTDKALATAARILRLNDTDTLLAQLGQATLTGSEVALLIYPDLAPKTGHIIEPARALIGLEPGQKFERAPCCQPLPGERIIGITYRGKGVVVHTIDCDQLAKFESQPERWLDLRWQEGAHEAAYSVTLDMTIGNDPGVLGRICTMIGKTGGNISDLKFLDRKPDFYRFHLMIELRDAQHLHSLLLSLEAENEVAQLMRFRDETEKASASSP